MLYNVVLDSVVQQHESVITIYIYIIRIIYKASAYPHAQGGPWHMGMMKCKHSPEMQALK